MIRKATITDLDGILEVLKEVGQSLKNPTQGFLMNDYTQDEALHRAKYARDLQELTYAYVYEEKYTILGFLLAYTRAQWLKETPDWLELTHWHPEFPQANLADFVLINQTALRPGYTGKGIGSQFYQALFRDMEKNKLRHVFAETIIAPVPNMASLHFRLKQKYQLAGVRYEPHQGTIYTTLVYHKTRG